MDTTAPKTIRLQDYSPPGWLIERVALDVNLHPTATRVRSRIGVRPNPAAAECLFELDGEGLQLDELRLNGHRVENGAFEATPTGLRVPGAPREAFELEITTFCNPEANTSLSGLYRSGGIFCTQCEAQGFRRITYFPDRPDVLAPYEVRIQADRELAPVLLSNGNPVAAGEVGNGGAHYAIWRDPHPKPSYLFAMVGGALGCITDSFTTASGRKVELRIYADPGKQDRCAWAMESLKRCMRWDEERFGREYDLDVFMIVAVADFNMGAMENKGLNIFNDKLILARPDTATDTDYAAIEAVIAHEYFHNWTGNRITCRDWFQLCLKEGLTVFRDQEFTSDIRSRPVKRISDVRMLRTHQFPEDSGPLAHPVRPDSYIEINNFYTATVYEKGAELCRMIQTLLTPAGFRKGMDLYFERHDGEAATVEDFVSAMADANGADLSRFMPWYTQAGTPELACSLRYDAGAKTADLTVTQVTPSTPGQTGKAPLHIPLRFGLLGSNGDELPLETQEGPVADGLLHVTQVEQTFRFLNVPSRPVPSLLRDFSAPVRITTSLSTEDLEFLLAHDPDPFNRWQAGQSYATRLMLDAVNRLRTGQALEIAPAYAQAIADTLSDANLEAAYRAEVLRLPSESDVARELGSNVDPDLVHAAHEALRASLCETLHGLLLDIYESNQTPGDYSPDADSTGKRALRNAALSVLAATGRADEIARVHNHYQDARNMTDKMAALAILCQHDVPARETALADFHDRWKGDHLVMDKWFALQATSSLPGTTERVAALAAHPLFSMKNPNKVRSLIGAFANINPTGFNRADGAGYRLVAAKILELDKINPQVAARLMGAFKSWKMLEPGRREMAHTALLDITARKDLSRDLYEIASKTAD